MNDPIIETLAISIPMLLSVLIGVLYGLTDFSKGYKAGLKGLYEEFKIYGLPAVKMIGVCFISFVAIYLSLRLFI